MELPQTCPKCASAIASANYFCHNCGKQLKDKPLSTSFFKQITIYAVSFLFPPFGLWPADKYLRQSDSKSKKIGLVAILLTAASILLAVWLTANLTTSLNKTLNDQLQFYQNIGY